MTVYFGGLIFLVSIATARGRRLSKKGTVIIDHNVDVTPDVIYRCSNTNGAFTTAKVESNGSELEIGLRAKIRWQGDLFNDNGIIVYNTPVADVWNYDFTINTEKQSGGIFATKAPKAPRPPRAHMQVYSATTAMTLVSTKIPICLRISSSWILSAWIRLCAPVELVHLTTPWELAWLL